MGNTSSTTNDNLTATASRLARIHALLANLTSAPWARDLIELAMAVAVCVKLSMAEASPPVWLLIIGRPGSGKTSVVLALRGLDLVVFMDKLTPEAWASGARQPRTGQQANALLPTLHGRCLVVKDLSTLFSQRPDKVRTVLGDLQSIFDGEYSKGVGTAFGGEKPILTHQSHFGLLACVTPDAVAQHQRYMAQMGSRFLACRVPKLTREQTAKGFELANNPERKKLQDQLRGLVHEHVGNVLENILAVTVPDWAERELQDLAQLVALGRTPLRWERTPNLESGQPRYEAGLGEPEDPFRVYQQLRTLLRGLTLINKRTEPTSHELELVRRVALSSVLQDRAEVLEVLQRDPVVWERTEVIHLDGEEEEVTVEYWGLTVAACARGIRRSEDQARNRLEELVRIGLMGKDPGRVKDGSRGQPQDLYRPLPHFEGLMLGHFELPPEVWEGLADAPQE